MTKKEIGQAVFKEAKKWLLENGASMDTKRFPSDFPVSRRTLYAIAKGNWTEATLAKLPFRVTVKYFVSFSAITATYPPCAACCYLGALSWMFYSTL